MTKLNSFDSLYIFSKKQNLIFLALCNFIFVFCFFGGGEPQLNFNLGLMFISSMFLIFGLAINNSYYIISRVPVYVKYFLIAPIILPLIQLIPIPADILASFPGQELRFDVLHLVGKSTTWQPISLAPKETAYTAAMGIFFLGFLIACIAIERQKFDFLALSLVIMVAIGALIGALQSSGAYPFLKFYEHAHNNAATGFFANKNHMALILSVSLLITKNLIFEKKWKHSQILFFSFTIFVFVSVVSTNSRAGILLVIIAIIFTNSAYLNNISNKMIAILILPFVSFLYYVYSSNIFNKVYMRFSDLSIDGRWDFLINSTSMMRDFFIFGSGYGSFSSIYMTREGIDSVYPFYTNHLHNDFLQLFIEGGLLSLVILAFLAFLIYKAWRASSTSQSSRSAVQTGLSIIALFAIHSVVDYPLRRPAAIVYFCIGLAYLIRELISEEDLSPKPNTSIAKRLTAG